LGLKVGNDGGLGIVFKGKYPQNGPFLPSNEAFWEQPQTPVESGKFLAKPWFQNLLAAKLSFQFLDVLVVYAPPSRVKRGKTMLPTVAKLLVKLHTPVTQPIVLPRWKIWEALIQRGYIEVVEIVFVSRLQNSKLNIIDSTRCFRYYPYNSKLLVV